MKLWSGLFITGVSLAEYINKTFLHSSKVSFWHESARSSWNTFVNPWVLLLRKIKIIISAIFIGPESDHWECLSVTESLTNSLLFSKIHWCEDDNSKLVEVVTVTHVDDEKRADNSLVQIWKVKFGHIVKFLFTLITTFQGLVKILKLKFCHYYAIEAWLWLWSFVEMLMFDWDF